MKRIYFLPLLCLLLSCGKATINYDTLAAAYCDCGQTSIEISNQMKKLMDQQLNTEFEKLALEASKAFKEAVECSSSARKKYEGAELDKEKLGKQILSNCPNMPTKFVMDLLEKIN